MNVLDIGVTGLGCPGKRYGSGPGTGKSFPSGSMQYQRSSPGFAGSGWVKSSHGPNIGMIQSPVESVGGFVVKIARVRNPASAVRSQPRWNLITSSGICTASSNALKSKGVPIHPSFLAPVHWINRPSAVLRDGGFDPLKPRRLPCISIARVVRKSKSLYCCRIIKERF